MLNQILIGQYIAANSFLHLLDPRTKLVSLVLIVFVVFGATQPYQLLAIGSITIFSYILSNIRLQHLYRGMRPILWFVYLTFFLHILLNKEGSLLWQFGFLSVYSEGVYQGLIVSFRLFVLIFFSTLLTLTTAPIQLTEGIESLLAPFKKVLPVHELALMLTISIRFIPTMLRETDRLIKAQMARGGSFMIGPIKERIKHVIPLIIPLLIMSFKRAEELATAMEARGYRGSVGRTKFKQLQYGSRDTLVFIVMALAIILVIWERIG